MKRYVVFGYSDFYPVGGMDDAQGSFDNKEDALKFVQDKGYNYDHYHMLDRVDGVVLRIAEDWQEVND